MQLNEFPTELLLRVARCLDPESLVALAKTNPRMESISLEVFKKRKIEKPKGKVLEFLHKYGPLVRSLDLSCSKFGPELNIVDLPSYIADFPHLRELNLVNSEVRHHDLLRSLCLLRELETLSFTMIDFKDGPVEHSEDLGPFSTVKKLYIEAGTAVWSCKAIIDLLNACEYIEFIHVNFIGSIDVARVNENRLDDELVPALKAERWRTLHTIICGRWLTYRLDEIQMFLQMLFTHNSSPECSLWIAEIKGNYIYERGLFNLNGRQRQLSFEESKGVDLLRKYQVVTESSIDEQPLRLQWDHPSSLRVNGVRDWSPELIRMSFLEMLSLQLEELDLTTCHGSYTEEFRLAVITSSPNLRVLALPICFFSSSNRDERGTRSLKRARRDGFAYFTEALKDSKLKKLTLEGAEKTCADCYNKLRGVNFIQLCDLSHLEELNLRNIRDADSSACENLWNRNLRTLRVQALTPGTFPGLRSLVQRCPNLRNLKLSFPQLLSNARNVTEVLAETSDLRQLCLDPWDRDWVPASRVQAILAELPQGIELVHVHLPRREIGHRKETGCLRQAVRDLGEARGVEICSEFSPPTLAHVEVGYTQSAPGRGPCFYINSVGYVPLVGWEVK